MKFIHYGKNNKKTILLIHAMGMDAKCQFIYLIEKLKQDYHIILLYLDGYDNQNTTFTTIQHQASLIDEYLINNKLNKLYMILGVSLGGYIAIDLLCRNNIKTNKLILDSVYMKPWKNKRLMAKALEIGFMNVINNKAGLITKLSMKIVLGYIYKQEDFHQNITRETIYNCEYSRLSYKFPLTSTLSNIDIVYWYGLKERFIKRSLKYIKAYIPNMKINSVGNFGHMEVMLKHKEMYYHNVLNELNKNNFVID